MSESLVSLHIDGPIATLTLHRPKQLNALNRGLISELGANIAMLSAEKNVRVVLLKGEGRAFAAGADIAEMADISATDAEQFGRLGNRVFTAFENLPQPTIALIHGYALGGGLELALSCDIRIAAEGSKFGQPEVQLGVITGFGGSQRLPRIVGQGRALHLLLTGETIDAEAAFNMGLVTKVVPQDALVDEGEALAKRLLAMGPKALGYMKRAVYEGAELDLSKGLTMEASFFGMCFATEDRREGMRAFLDKRKAEFKNQ